MENKIKIFLSDNFGSLTTILINDEPYFIGKEVAEMLGYGKGNKNSKALTNAIALHVDNEDAKMLNHAECKKIFSGHENGDSNIAINSNGMKVINESGLYSLIFGSKLPKAKEFKHWVTSEVLPTIRKTGGYVNNEDLFINTYLPFADDNTKTLFRATLSTINQLNTKIEKDKPLVEFAEHIQVSDDCISMNDMAKLASKQGIKIGRNNLFKLLREKKILKADNVPYQRYIEQQPWFQVKESTYENSNVTHLTLTTMVTAQGQKGIIKMLKKVC